MPTMAYRTPKPIVPSASCRPRSPNAMPSASRPLTMWTMSCTVFVRNSAFGSSLAIGLLGMNPMRPAPRRATPATIIQVRASRSLSISPPSPRPSPSCLAAARSPRALVTVVRRRAVSGRPPVSGGTAHRGAPEHGSARCKSVTMAAMPAKVTSARYVGRDREFGRLAAVLDRARGGRATTVLVPGPAGIGVSRFLDEATNRLGDPVDGFTVLRGRAYGPADPPYATVTAALGPALAALDDTQL